MIAEIGSCGAGGELMIMGVEVTMDSTGLRAAQQPLKDAYREDPRAAAVTLRARGELGEEEISSVRLTERYCVVYQTLAHPVGISTTAVRKPA